MNTQCDDADDADDPARSAKVRELNDAFRKTLAGGIVLMTAGVVALGADAQAEALAKVQAFDAFSGDNDPWAEHDFGEIEVAGERLFWKLDYFDLTRAFYRSTRPTRPSPSLVVWKLALL